jgi:transcriptional regulator with XRE-family HTH domain
MATAISEQHVGLLLREWRERGRLSQLELALEAGVSARATATALRERAHQGR